ncbi:aminoglycoside phosphotransferase family protein [Urbifossiella limnaea]|uniref:Phosphotransferase enzyme family protein n=1 Tax=Urbifossiella limnaea TaxID=2528023 RepID=A0A517XQT7_9BACT|nr:aminoglycoside phosphotransferase family protein [Urbifossiella limnaea]QDU19888.1 Phosphotransferase enzyme family protein [Urbifossiella limnaea]
MGGVDRQAVIALADAAGVGPATAVLPLAGGANNRVYRLDTATGPVLLKSYFRHPADPRDRLGAEWAFLRFAAAADVRWVPQPLAVDPPNGLALYEYVPGEGMHGTTAAERDVDVALAFYRALHAARNRVEAGNLPRASESCFSLDDHFATVARRVERLRSIPINGDTDTSAAAFVNTELVPAWRSVHTSARAQAAASGLYLDRPLDPADRCVSPSDFGFHNCLREPSGRLRFIDFEYAGWDDPAKLVCDFFCQPAVPAPTAAFDRFSSAVGAGFAEPLAFQARAALLLPVYRVKWVCIMLNEFLPVGGSRRAFAGSAAEHDARKAAQLGKARAALAAVVSSPVPLRKVA